MKCRMEMYSWAEFEEYIWMSSDEDSNGLFHQLSLRTAKSESSSGTILFPNRQCFGVDEMQDGAIIRKFTGRKTGCLMMALQALCPMQCRLSAMSRITNINRGHGNMAPPTPMTMALPINTESGRCSQCRPERGWKHCSDRTQRISSRLSSCNGRI